MHRSDIFDANGNFIVGPRTRNTGTARITVDFAQGDTNGIALDVAATPDGVSERAVIKLGDYVIGQDTAKTGVKDFAILNADGVKVGDITGGSVPRYQFSIPLIVAPTGSIADGGVLTSGTANPLTYLKTYTWFPTGALYATTTTPASASNSPAGWYYTVWTTTTAAQVYANTWDGASEPTVPTTLTSLDATTGTGPGAFTGPTAEAAYITLALPAAGVNSKFELNIQTHQTNNSNVKTLKSRLTDVSGTTLSTFTLTSLLHADTTTVIGNNGVADKQRVTATMVSAAAVARQTPALAAVTLSAAFALAVTVTKATATDVLVIEGLTLRQFR